MSASITATREIGPVGTAARVAVGLTAIGAAAWTGPSLLEALVGLILVPLVVTLVMSLRGAEAPPLRAHGPIWHVVNIAAGVAFFSVAPVSALLFYGASMLVAAWRGYGACELLAFPNLIRRRDDQLACPLFLPVDLAESRVTGRQLYCS